MTKTLNPYSSTAKTAEIMSRYRPIAPKPDHSPSSISQKLNQTAYDTGNGQRFQLQARSGTRTKKRGRSSSASILPQAFKRPKTHIAAFTENIMSLPAGFNISALSQPRAVNTSLVTLPLLPCQPSFNEEEHNGIDLNTAPEVPEEKDILHQLLDRPPSNVVIAPQPVRPVGSSIKVGCISEKYPSTTLTDYARSTKKREEVEKEVESDAFPAVISDSNNKVRMANSAYNEMVGQPECSWLDSMVMGDGRLGCSSCKRICGDVMLQFSDSVVPVSSNGFSCWVRIEWGSDGNRNSINAFCDVIRLCCESRDYVFTWRFHTRRRGTSQ